MGNLTKIQLMGLLVAGLAATGCSLDASILSTLSPPPLKFNASDINSGTQKGTTADDYKAYTSVGDPVVLKGKTNRNYQVNLSISGPAQE